MIFSKWFKTEQENDWSDAVRSNPRDVHGNVLALDDVVIFNDARYRIVAMSHRGKVAIRHLSITSGAGAKWVPASSVEFLTSGEVA